MPSKTPRVWIECNRRSSKCGRRCMDLGGDLAGKTLDDLSDTAYAQLSSSHGTVCWRQLYTDRKLFRTLIGLIKPVDEKTAKICIARLDYAIIVAGPCEEGRGFVPIPLFLLRIQYLPSMTSSKPSHPSRSLSMSSVQFCISPSLGCL